MSRHHYGSRLREFTENGFRMLSLENELIRVELRIDNGGEFSSFLYKPSDTDFLWHRPVAPRKAPVQSRPRGIDEHVFNDRYLGGWQECFPNGGTSVVYKNAQLPFHGELLSLDFSLKILRDTPDEVSVLLSVETLRMPFLLEKQLRLRSGSSVLEIKETMTNLSDQVLDTMWGQHPAFGPPFVDDSCHIDFPPCRCTTERSEPWPESKIHYAVEFDWPNAPLRDGGFRDLSVIPAPDARLTELVFLHGFNEGWYGVTNGNKKVGFGLRWDASLFPYLWFWQVFGGFSDYPWFRRNYNFALEPFSSFPESGLLKAIENGTALRFGPHETKETTILAVAYAGRERINRITETGEVL
ncbi:DUF4432 family protein [Marispirochaeta aestuarii]|uniref:DUF4432 family protein n=1 Tax=Marispirochaeta aestuarii TaxID=1963862 RepID=UPI0029C9631C|nr:DUF4432 family protein [Marispirochaeta aestuarii]